MTSLVHPRRRHGQAGRPDRVRIGARGAQAAFTMVEIAICIAIVAFAMVAIIGVMPTGFQVQKQNREDTIINQEANFWMEAIRGGSLGLDYLTNHVDRIAVQTSLRPAGSRSSRDVAAELRFQPVGAARGFKNGRDIIGLLSLPRYYSDASVTVVTRLLRAHVRALSGIAAEKTTTNDFAFTYQLTPELLPYNPAVGMPTNLTQFNLPPAELATRSNLLSRVHSLGANLYEMKLTLDWPVYERNGRFEVGSNRRVFRTLISGGFVATNPPYLDPLVLFFFQPSEFVFAR